MPRATVLALLRNDTELAALEPGLVIVPQYSFDQRPNGNDIRPPGNGPFIVICWRTTDFAVEIQSNGPKHFDLYVHMPVKTSTDYGRIDAMIDRCDEIFGAVEDNDPVLGSDHWQLEIVGFQGRGPDITDQGYETICREASYYALGSKQS
jgi:hypothetical protein